jgi:hypothetical protein
MAYSKQTFSVAQVLTATQTNQLETNIADHKHGQDNVLGSGITFRTPKDKTAGYTVTTADVGDIITCNGTFTVSIDPLANFSAGAGFTVANRGTGTITVDGDGSETINGNTTFTVGANAATTFYKDSNASEWKTFGGGGVLSNLGTFDSAGQVATQLTGIDMTAFNIIFVHGYYTTSSTTGYIRARIEANSTVQTGALYDWEQESAAATTSQTSITIGNEAGAGTGDKSGVFEFLMYNGANTENDTDRSPATGWARSNDFTNSGSTAFELVTGWQSRHTDVLANAVSDIQFFANTGNINIRGTVFGKVDFD